MKMPITPECNKPNALDKILESIAHEEDGIAHLLNAEGDKVEAVACLIEAGEITPLEVIDFQKSISKVIQTFIKMQMLLQFKLEIALESKNSTEVEDI